MLNFTSSNYQFCNKYFKQGVANSWFPNSVPLSLDRDMYHTKLGVDEKRQLDNMIGFFCNSEDLVRDNILDALARSIPVPEVKNYLARQSYEECNHSESFAYIIKELDMNKEEIYNKHKNMSSIQAKQDFDKKFTTRLLLATSSYELNPDETNTKIYFESLLQNLVAYYAVLEGIFFFSGFVIAINFQKNALMPKVGEIIKYILRDESAHLTCGMMLAKTLMADNPHLMTPELKNNLINIIKEGVEIETKYAHECIGNSVITKADNYIEYMQSIANKRLVYLGFPAQYDSKANAMKHLITSNDAPELVNFFETEQINYERV